MAEITLAHKIMAAIIANEPIMIHGDVGLGKTSEVYRVGRTLDRDVFPFIGSLREPTDITGPMYLDNTDGEVKIAKPYLFSKLEKLRDPILFFDEYSLTPRATQSALLRLVYERAIDDWKLPENTSVVAASNFIDVVGNSLLSSATANRFLHVTHTSSPKEWINSRSDKADVSFKYSHDWMKHIPEYDAVIMELVEKHPEHFHKVPDSFDSPMDYAFSTPRSNTAAAKMLALTVNDPDMSKVMVAAAVGVTFSNTIHSYLKNRDNSLSFVNIDIDNFKFPESPSVVSQLIKAAALYAKQLEYSEKSIRLFNMAYDSGFKPTAMQYAILLAKNLFAHMDAEVISDRLPFVGKILFAGAN